jgi:two-component system, NarL family, response regulator DevR
MTTRSENGNRPEQFRVLLVDDHQIVRRGLKTVLEERSRLSVVGEAGTVRDAVVQAERLQPDVIVMDLRLPDGSGIEACREIRSRDPSAKVVILTSFADEDALFSAVMAGAAGYVLKDLDPSMLQDSLVTVAQGGSLLDPKMTTRVLERLRRGQGSHPADDRFSTLTPQEDRILTMIGDGHTNREIADKLALTEKTIKNYVSQIYSKLQVSRRPQAARLATERRMRKQG